MNKRASRTPAWLHALRLAFPPVVTLVLVVLTEWIARGSLTVDSTATSAMLMTMDWIRSVVVTARKPPMMV